jgi:hypothetical protein
MPVLHVASAAAAGPGTHTEASQTTILITEREVALSTAAATSLPRTAPTRGWDDVPRVVATLRRMFLASTPRPQGRDATIRSTTATWRTLSWDAKWTGYKRLLLGAGHACG